MEAEASNRVQEEGRIAASSHTMHTPLLYTRRTRNLQTEEVNPNHGGNYKNTKQPEDPTTTCIQLVKEQPETCQQWVRNLHVLQVCEAFPSSDCLDDGVLHTSHGSCCRCANFETMVTVLGLVDSRFL